jgi:hypothetical protein
MKEFVVADPYITATHIPNDCESAVLILACDGVS